MYYFDNCTRIYIYGYSNQGRNAYNKLNRIYPDKVKGFIVTKHDGRTRIACKEENKKIYELSEISDLKNALVVVALNPIFHREVGESLIQNGLKSFITYDNAMDENLNSLLSDLPKLEVRLLAVCVGQACNLKCRDCMNFAPYTLCENTRYEIDRIKKDLDNTLQYFDEVDTFHIQGGEPFLYTDLGELLYYCRFKFGNILKKIQIATNGTVIPNADILKALADTNSIVRISNYPTQKNSAALVEILDEYKILYKQYNFANRKGEWSLGGGIDYAVPIDEDVEDKFNRCKWNTCYTIENSMIGRCARSIPAQTLQKINIKDDDYIDLNQENDIVRMGKYFMFLNPMTCCWHCKGSQGEPIQPAVQIIREEM